jgi:hypothetical protein
MNKNLRTNITKNQELKFKKSGTKNKKFGNKKLQKSENKSYKNFKKMGTKGKKIQKI